MQRASTSQPHTLPWGLEALTSRSLSGPSSAAAMVGYCSGTIGNPRLDLSLWLRLAAHTRPGIACIAIKPRVAQARILRLAGGAGCPAETSPGLLVPCSVVVLDCTESTFQMVIHPSTQYRLQPMAFLCLSRIHRANLAEVLSSFMLTPLSMHLSLSPFQMHVAEGGGAHGNLGTADCLQSLLEDRPWGCSMKYAW